MQRQLALILAASIVAICGWGQPRPAEAAPADDIGVLKVQGNVYMLVAADWNIAAQVGDDGILVVDTGTGAYAAKVAAALRKLSDKPVS
jgi:hypothetical protein